MAVFVCGGAVLDCVARPADASQRGASQTSLPGVARFSPGGVGRNIAEAVARLGGRSRLFSAVGADDAGGQLLEACRAVGIDVGATVVAPRGGARTATCTILLDGAGDLVGAIADMGVFDTVGAAELRAAADAGLEGARLAVCDSNLSGAVLEELLACASARGIPAWYEPVSVAKTPRGRCSRPWHMVTPNLLELYALLGKTCPAAEKAEERSRELSPAVLSALEEAFAAGLARHVLLTMGANGALLASASGDDDFASAASPPASCEVDFEALLGAAAAAGVPPLRVAVERVEVPWGRCLWYKPQPLEHVQDVTGAGDALLSGMAAGFGSGLPLPRAVLVGMACAHLTLFADGAVSPLLGPQLLRLQDAAGGTKAPRARL